MAIKSFTFPVSVGRNIYQAINSAAAICNEMQLVQSTEAVAVHWNLLSLKKYCKRGSRKLFHHLRPTAAAMKRVLLNLIYWLPREITNSLISEGGTQNEGNICQLRQII